MTSDEYRKLLKRLGLSQVGAAALLRVNAVTSRRWAKYGITGIADLFLQMLNMGKITVADIVAVRLATTAHRRRKRQNQPRTR
jgi:hypothetical protein